MNKEILKVSLLTFGLVISCSKNYDASFPTDVPNPAFKENHPRVLFDAAHRNFHTSEDRYRPFTELIRNDGYHVVSGEEKFTKDLLSGYDILIIANARGSNAGEDSSAFTATEILTIVDWVDAGGSLLLITDHYPFGSAAEKLAAAFQVGMGKGMTEDPEHYDTETKDQSQLVFSTQNGLLQDHPLVEGRNTNERIERVVTFTGQSLRANDDNTIFLQLAKSAVDYKPEVKVRTDGNDTRVSINYDGPYPTLGNAQGIALEKGKGRVIILGEAAMLTAQLNRDGKPVGMNAKGNDNRQLALNIMHWLSHLI